MAKGLFGFLGFGRREKPSLTPAFETPKQEELPFTAPLSQLARSRLKGEGLGYGEDFLGKSTNPAIAKLESSFQRSTLPRISSEASARGLGRSSIVLDQIGQAEQEKNRDVADLISKFYVLNKAQEKQDLTEGMGLGERLQGQALDIGKTKAEESRNLRDVTLGQANARNARADQMQGLTLQALGGAVSGFAGAPQLGAGNPLGGVQGMLKQLGVGSTVGKQYLLGNDEKSALLKLLLEQ